MLTGEATASPVTVNSALVSAYLPPQSVIVFLMTGAQCPWRINAASPKEHTSTTTMPLKAKTCWMKCAYAMHGASLDTEWRPQGLKAALNTNERPCGGKYRP